MTAFSFMSCFELWAYSFACPVYPVAPEDDTGVKSFGRNERSEFNRGTAQHRPVLSFIDFSKGSVKLVVLEYKKHLSFNATTDKKWFNWVKNPASKI